MKKVNQKCGLFVSGVTSSVFKSDRTINLDIRSFIDVPKGEQKILKTRSENLS